MRCEGHILDKRLSEVTKDELKKKSNHIKSNSNGKLKIHTFYHLNFPPNFFKS